MVFEKVAELIAEKIDVDVPRLRKTQSSRI